MPDIFLYAGEANPNDIKLRDPTTAGASQTFSYTGTGGLVFGGAAALAKGKAISGTGGLVFAGEAVVAKGKSFTASGGLSFGGSATLARAQTFTAGGGFAFGGAVTIAITKAFPVSGGAVFGGQAATSYVPQGTVFTYTATGGIALAGEASTYEDFQSPTPVYIGGGEWIPLKKLVKPTSRRRKKPAQQPTPPSLFSYQPTGGGRTLGGAAPHSRTRVVPTRRPMRAARKMVGAARFSRTYAPRASGGFTYTGRARAGYIAGFTERPRPKPIIARPAAVPLPRDEREEELAILLALIE